MDKKTFLKLVSMVVRIELWKRFIDLMMGRDLMSCAKFESSDVIV